MLLRSLAAWLWWRWLELAIAAALATLTVFSPWLAILPGVFLAWWASHEYRTHRPRPTPPPSAAPDATVDDERSEATA